MWFCGGLAMFLVSMFWLRRGVEMACAEWLRAVLLFATDSRWKAVAVGFLVTLVVQSSSATAILTVGLVCAGWLQADGAICVLLGANVGTTITAQLLRFVQPMHGSWLLSLLNAQNFTPIFWLLALAAIVRKKDALSMMLMGLAMLFSGMLIMRQSATLILQKPWFADSMECVLQSPLLGFGVGFAVSMLLQSSSASVGLVQSLCIGAAFRQVYAILIGITIGAALATSIVARFGANAAGIRVCHAFLQINLLTALVDFVAVLSIYRTNLWNLPMQCGTIADVHTVFRLLGAVCIYPMLTVPRKYCEIA